MKYILGPRYTHAELVRLAHQHGYTFLHKIYHKHGTEIVVTNDANYKIRNNGRHEISALSSLMKWQS